MHVPCLNALHTKNLKYEIHVNFTRYSSEHTLMIVNRQHKANYTVEKDNVALDNQWVVPYNKDSLFIYQFYINVKI